MGLIGWKSLLVVGLSILGLGWGIGNGYVRWQTEPYKCFDGKGYYSAVPKQTLISVGRLHIYYQPKTWGCDGDHRYDPDKYDSRDGRLIPKGQEL